MVERDCPNRPEWAASVPATQQGKCMWCSKVAGEWVVCKVQETAFLAWEAAQEYANAHPGDEEAAEYSDRLYREWNTLLMASYA